MRKRTANVDVVSALFQKMVVDCTHLNWVERLVEQQVLDAGALDGMALEYVLARSLNVSAKLGVVDSLLGASAVIHFGPSCGDLAEEDVGAFEQPFYTLMQRL